MRRSEELHVDGKGKLYNFTYDLYVPLEHENRVLEDFDNPDNPHGSSTLSFRTRRSTNRRSAEGRQG